MKQFAVALTLALTPALTPALTSSANAAMVNFTVQATIDYASDSFNLFPSVGLGTVFTVTVAFDTTQATPANPTYAWYTINAPAYITATGGALNLVADNSGPNYLYVVVSHPTVDYVNYFAPTTNLPGARLQLYLQGPKGTLPGPGVQEDFLSYAWDTQFFQFDFMDPNTGQSAMFRGTLNPVPGPSPIIALLGAAALLKRRRTLR